MLKYESEGVGISIDFDRYDGVERRQSYKYVIYEAMSDGRMGDVLYSADDLRCGSGDDAPLAKMLATLLGFLSAWAESGEDGENADLFSRELADRADWQEWADAARDNLVGGTDVDW